MKKYDILNDLVKFNTIDDKENKEIIDYIESVLKSKNFRTDYKGKYLIMSYGNNPQIGFLGHTDTVEFINGWNTDPFTLKETKNKLYGLGVCDMKSGIAAMLDAILSCNLSDIQNGIKLYFTYDEEKRFGGIYDIIKAGEKFPDFMIFGEPTYNEVLIGCKGLLECDLHFKGIKVHSSNPAKGKSANLNAIRFLSELEKFYIENIKNDISNEFDIPYTTMNVGILRGGSAKNSIPAECYATLDFRVIKSEHIEKITEMIDFLSKKYDCDYEMLEKIKPFMNEVDVENNRKTANFLTEASVVNCKSKIILGAGPVTAHEINEYIEKESYDKLVKQYKNIIEKYI